MDGINTGNSNREIKDSVIQGNVQFGDSIAHQTNIVSSRVICAYCESSGVQTFFRCSTLNCSNDYCEHCEHKSSEKCGICYSFENKIHELISEEKEAYDGLFMRELKQTEQRAMFTHFSNNIQLITFLILLSFSDFILNRPHGFEVIGYSFFGLVSYNFISEFLRDEEINLIYIVDIIIVIAVCLMSIYFSHLITGTLAGFTFGIISSVFIIRCGQMFLLIFDNTRNIEFRSSIDISAISYLICIVFYFVKSIV